MCAERRGIRQEREQFGRKKGMYEKEKLSAGRKGRNRWESCWQED